MQLGQRRWGRPGGPALTFTELGLGTAPLANLYRPVTEEAADAVLAAAWAGGVRYFDTAPLYGLGLAETRLNRFLRGKRREEYLLSTKVGRLLRPCPPGQHTGIGKWFEVPDRAEVYDYTHDGVMRSLEHSLERLGVARVDILYVHDLDVWTHGSREALAGRMAEFLGSGYRAMRRLREEKVVSAIGAGLNETGPAIHLIERCDLDLILMAGRYTLLEQGAAEAFLPLCLERGIGVVIGGPYNSGILATGPRPGAHYDYAPAPEAVLARARRLEAACAAAGVRLVDAAFRYPLRHPAVVSVIPGGQGLSEMESNLAAARAEIPEALWEGLRAEGLIP